MTRYRLQRWRNRAQSFSHAMPADVADWLFDPSSLTARLIRHCTGSFSVKVLSQGYAQPRLSESRVLKMHQRETALIREVHLLCDQHPVVYARTVIPVSTLTGAQKHLSHLGNKPLGAVLFSDQSMQREEMQIACLKARQVKLLTADEIDVWGRRSVFKLSAKPLLVSEYFLPELFEVSK
ncbi:MAG: chorismate lyase [Gammaproteobacteria bacterium]|nr:chorismate lyase [Gammaproteobacteria bacterium]